MKLFVGINWDLKLIDEFDKLNQKYAPDVIDEVYGSMRGDPLGQVREADRLTDVSSAEVAVFVKRAHEKNIKVCYAINSPIITPRHLAARSGDVVVFLNWLCSMEIDNVIVASPAFAKYLKEWMNTKEFGVIGSTVLNLRTLEQMEKFQGIFDRICPATDRNRDTLFLYKTNEVIPVELLVNEMCLYQCPWRNYHYCQEAVDNPYMMYDVIEELKDFPIDECWRCFVEDPVNIIKSRWVRPEDTHIYEEFGIEWFKLSGRTMSTEWISRTTEAYVSRQYNGNLLDLFPIVAGSLSTEKHGDRKFYIDNARIIDIGHTLIARDRGSCLTGCRQRSCDLCTRLWEDYVNEGIAGELNK